MSGGWGNPWGGGSGGAATGTATPQPLGVAAAGNAPAASHEDHIHRLPYLAELNAWGVPTGWNANTNSPALASGIANATNTAFIVTTSGSTTLDGITSWVVGDIAYFDAAAAAWRKVSASPFDITTWAARGTGDFVGQIKLITDAGETGGLFKWDGTYWMSIGRLRLVRRNGSNAAVIDGPKTGASIHSFTLPVACVIPAGMITPHSRVLIEGLCRRSGATGTANFDATFGTLNSSSDNIAVRVTMNATDNHVGRLFAAALIGPFSSGKATSYLAHGVAAPHNSTAAGSTYADRTTNFDTSVATYVNFGMSSANAADSFSLHSYAVYLEP